MSEKSAGLRRGVYLFLAGTYVLLNIFMNIHYVWTWGCDVIAHVIRTWGIFQMVLEVHYSSLMKDFFVSSYRFLNTVFEKGPYHFFLKNLEGEILQLKKLDYVLFDNV